MSKLLETLKEKFGEETTIIKPDQEFIFTCTACGECCKNRTGPNSIILSSHDIFNLRKNLGLTFQELFKKHLSFALGTNSGLPVMYLGEKVSLYSEESMCTFLKKIDGSYRCSVHAFKPTVCSLYPLGRVTATEKDSDQKEIHYLYLGSDCSNNNKTNTHSNTVNEWVKNREDTETIFLKNSEAMARILKIIKLRQLFDSKKFTDGTKEIIQNVLIFELFDNFDTDKDFFVQFDRNINTIEDYLKSVVSMLRLQDKSIVSDFKDFKSIDEIAKSKLNKQK